MKFELKEILKITESGGGSLYHFECQNDTSDALLKIVTDIYKNVGAVCRNEGYYEHMTVKTYLGMFAEFPVSSVPLDTGISRMQLQDILHCKIRKLTDYQKYRVSAAREIILDKDVLFVQEPILGTDRASVRLMIDWIETCGSQGKKVITTSQSLKHVYLLSGRHFFADGEHIEELTENIFSDREGRDQKIVEKIPAKTEEKILLFNPNEIDYIESMQGKNYLHVRQARFQCPMTMDELYGRLKRFGFFRSHRSYIVNMQKVSEVIKWTKNSYSLRMKDGEEEKIPLSKGRIDELREFYGF